VELQYTVLPDGSRRYDLVGLNLRETATLAAVLADAVKPFCASAIMSFATRAQEDKVEKDTHNSLHCILDAMRNKVPSPAQVAANDQREAAEKDKGEEANQS